MAGKPMLSTAKNMDVYDREPERLITCDAEIEDALALLADCQLTLDQLFYQLAARRISSGKSL